MQWPPSADVLGSHAPCLCATYWVVLRSTIPEVSLLDATWLSVVVVGAGVMLAPSSMDRRCTLTTEARSNCRTAQQKCLSMATSNGS